MAVGGYRVVHYFGTTLLAAAAALGVGYAVATEGAPPRAFFLDPIATARQLADAGQHLESAAEYRTLASLDPADLQAYQAWAAALDAAGDPDAALRAHLAAVAARPRDAAAHRQLGAAFYERGRVDDALGSLTTALRLRPADATALTLVGDLLRQRGRSAQAVEMYRRALALAPGAITHNKLGIALGDIGQIDAALEHFQRAVEIDAGLAEARTNRDRASDYLAGAAKKQEP